jgi:hypothetical protein
VFKNAKLSTAIVTSTYSGMVPHAASDICVRTYPWNSLTDLHKESRFKLADALLLDPVNCPIPLVDQKTLELCVKVHKTISVAPLGVIPDFEVNRGEINQTIFRSYIDDEPKHKRLVKGVEIGAYRENRKLSQGKREWFDEAAYLKKHEPRNIIHSRRIATQRITGVDERLRIVATIIDPPAYFADSTNSIVANGGVHPLEYLLGLLNSRLFQWRFKLTSTNNNVGTNELNSMPFRSISNENPEDRKLRDHLLRMVDRMLKINRQNISKDPHDQVRSKRSAESTLREIDKTVYRLYDLTEDEVSVIEGKEKAGGP